MTLRNYGGIIVILLVIIGLCVASMAENHNKNVTGLTNFQKRATTFSKAEIIKQINRLTAEAARIEKNEGITGAGGFIVYPSLTTSKLLALYHALDLRLTYLNTGKMPSNREQWDGFVLTGTQTQSFTPAQVMKVMAELKTNGMPDNFLNGFRVFLLPHSIPNISGLGGAGFVLISTSDSFETDSNMEAELAVTLAHETGHHIHMSFMPKGTFAGEKYWRQYLALRGGVWHGPGKVNTVDWSNSSEETFAEDFRMLFGNGQPYFGDLASGDPRTDPEQAADVKRFMIQLAQQKPKVAYHSPWIPLGMNLTFWKKQDILIPLMWACLGVTGFIINRHDIQKKPGYRNLAPAV